MDDARFETLMKEAGMPPLANAVLFYNTRSLKLAQRLDYLRDQCAPLPHFEKLIALLVKERLLEGQS